MKKFSISALVTIFLITLCFLSFTSQAEPINVIINEGNTIPWIKQTVKAYEAKFPDRKVNVQVIGGTQDNYYTKLTLMLKSDSSADVVFQDSFMLKSSVDANLLAPLKISKWKQWDEFYPALRKSVSLDSKIYGVPLSTDSRGLYYNSDIFKKAGIKTPWNPKNWNDLITASKEIKKKVPGVFPFTLNVTNTGEQTSMQTFEMLLYGAKTNNNLLKDGKWIATSQSILNSLKFINTLCREQLVPRLGILLNPQYGTIMPSQLATKQKVAIILDGCWIDAYWAKNYKKTAKEYKFIPMPTEFGQAPGHISMSGGWMLAISNKSLHKKLALDFIEFAMDKQNLLRYTEEVRNLATRKDVAASKKYPASLKLATSFLEFTHFRPANESYPMVSAQIQNMVESVATGQSTPMEAMTTYAAALQRVLGSKKIVKLYKTK